MYCEWGIVGHELNDHEFGNAWPRIDFWSTGSQSSLECTAPKVHGHACMSVSCDLVHVPGTAAPRNCEALKAPVVALASAQGTGADFQATDAFSEGVCLPRRQNFLRARGADGAACAAGAGGRETCEIAAGAGGRETCEIEMPCAAGVAGPSCPPATPPRVRVPQIKSRTAKKGFTSTLHRKKAPCKSVVTGAGGRAGGGPQNCMSASAGV